MAHHYHLLDSAATPSQVTGRYLAHNRFDRIGRAFMAADLFTGVTRLTKPTMTQSASLARVSDTYGWWALKRMADRDAIEHGLIPLVPSPSPKANGFTLPVSITGVIPDPDLIEFVRTVGVDRVLSAAVVVEAAE